MIDVISQNISFLLVRKTDNNDKTYFLFYFEMFANFLHGNTDCYSMSQFNDCNAIIKVRRN